jgi:hypothetical protein
MRVLPRDLVAYNTFSHCVVRAVKFVIISLVLVLLNTFWHYVVAVVKLLIISQLFFPICFSIAHDVKVLATSHSNRVEYISNLS